MGSSSIVSAQDSVTVEKFIGRAAGPRFSSDHRAGSIVAMGGDTPEPTAPQNGAAISRRAAHGQAREFRRTANSFGCGASILKSNRRICWCTRGNQAGRMNLRRRCAGNSLPRTTARW